MTQIIVLSMSVRRAIVNLLIRASKDIVTPVLLPQIQLLNAHMLQLGLEEQLYVYGQQIGAEIARLAAEKMGIEEMTLDEVIEWTPFIIKHLTMGIARAEVVEVNREKGSFRSRVYNSPYAKLPDGTIIKRNKPACYLLAGISAGGATRLLKKPYKIVEVKCIAMGDPYCEFLNEPV